MIDHNPQRFAFPARSLGARALALLLLASLLAASSVQAQSRPAEWSPPANLGPTINSPHDEVFPMISKEGLSLYFASDRPGGFSDTTAEGMSALDLYVARRATLDAPWSAPKNLGPTINTPYAEHSATFSTDGHWMFFASNRPGGCGKHDLYASYREDTRDDFGWEKPANLGCALNSAGEDSCPFYHVDEATGAATLYFVSIREGGLGSWDVYKSALVSAPVTFGAPVWMKALNSAKFEGHFEADEDLLWSGRPGGRGKGDLWKVARNAGAWSFTNLGRPVNTEAEEGMPSVSGDGRRLYFPSDRPDGYGKQDLYVSTRRRGGS